MIDQVEVWWGYTARTISTEASTHGQSKSVSTFIIISTLLFNAHLAITKPHTISIFLDCLKHVMYGPY